ncbi:MAG: two-component system response regulator [Nitrospirae bacterium GWC2_57_13]|jgi:DNA-binding response OmpR family regulator|nr:MAG: two-component system response regulator [Nitrospirae bacterium GWC1_57_7]OGW27599.1 MAG: two-component system response regulator [Nitrospirae bacterium GWC2_57_13]OGW44759.1 MAG: two-component system response regulator [Nitrospirae bacterium GWD2_57_8]HAR45166.1 two-component system response regulator [Nitrospiraceae bacterium]HAS55210.1 two-component system response regulator [Nitrospiraceae bacterium]
MAKILIADDSLAELQLFQAALQSTGHSIVTAMDGEAAEEKVKTEKIDLIILDVVMPKKNGFQVCRDIKNNEKFKNIPIIMVTSKDQESDKFWGMKQGADEYLIKPFQPEDLLKAVKKYI